MFSTFSLPFTGWLKSGRSGAPIDLPPVPVHDVSKIDKPSARRLKHLLKANHANYSIIYGELHFHNHTPHVLGSAYILGATPEQLNAFYEEESKHHEAWQPSPGEISKEDWRDFLGKHECGLTLLYQRAFVDFFEDQLVAFGYDWKPLVEHYMYEGDKPLINSVVSGPHPLIHLGYAYELNSQDVAIEALGLTACFYDTLHKYLDDPSYTRPSSYQSPSPLEILQKVSHDDRLNDTSPDKGPAHHAIILQTRESILLDHWNAWQIHTDSDPLAQFVAVQKAAVALLVATRRPGEQYDFFLLHLLTSSHAVRILLPLVPVRFQIPLVRQWFLFALLAYIGQLRPAIDMGVIDGVEVQGNTWKHVDHAALGGGGNGVPDVHFVKGLRAMHNAAETWGDGDQYFLKAAVKFAEEFGGWGGLPAGVEA